jgi:hypothetical protein
MITVGCEGHFMVVMQIEPPKLIICKVEVVNEFQDIFPKELKLPLIGNGNYVSNYYQVLSLNLKPYIK